MTSGERCHHAESKVPCDSLNIDSWKTGDIRMTTATRMTTVTTATHIWYHVKCITYIQKKKKKFIDQHTR